MIKFETQSISYITIARGWIGGSDSILIKNETDAEAVNKEIMQKKQRTDRKIEQTE